MVRLADVFEASADQSLRAGSFAGFRAARWVARCVRQARLRARKPGEAAPAAVLDSWERAARRWVEELRKPPATVPEEEVKAYQSEDLALELGRVQELRGEMEQSSKARARVLEAIDRAERAPSDPATMSEPGALRKIAEDLAGLESVLAFLELSADLRARALFARALAEVVSDLLDGETVETVRDRRAPPVHRAYGVDPKVDAAWRARLSPRLLSVLDRIGRR